MPLNSTRRPIRSVGRLSWAASAAETVVVVWCCPAQLQSGPVVANGGRLPYPPKRPGVRGVERPGALRCTRDGLPGALHRRREPVRVTTRSPSSQNAIGVGRVSASRGSDPGEDRPGQREGHGPLVPEVPCAAHEVAAQLHDAGQTGGDLEGAVVNETELGEPTSLVAQRIGYQLA